MSRSYLALCLANTLNSNSVISNSGLRLPAISISALSIIVLAIGIFSAQIAAQDIFVVGDFAKGASGTRSSLEEGKSKDGAPHSAIDVSESEKRGLKLFLRKWRENDPLAGDDGLGPMYNATSCVSCHAQGAIGGGGSNQHNVHLLTIDTKNFAKQANASKSMGQRIKKIHPGMVSRNGVQQSIVLHHYGLDANYESFKKKLLALEPKTDLSPEQHQAFVKRATTRLNKSGTIYHVPHHQNGRSLVVTQRNTPALFGSYLIDDIPLEVLQEKARQQSKRNDQIRGRVPMVTETNPGRFGWRGQTSTTKDFVLAACAVELGLGVKTQSQAPNPLEKQFGGSNSDLTPQQTGDLINYVLSLPRPKQILPRDEFQLRSVQHGEYLFKQNKCSVCHSKNLGEVEGIYSDLLLHQMGKTLTDPVAAVSLLDKPPVRSNGYYVARLIAEIKPERKMEWQTPPLWGVADSAPYLHDGRAATLRDAILMHGGTAADSVRRFKRMDEREKLAVIEFLKTLKSPQKSQEVFVAR